MGVWNGHTDDINPSGLAELLRLLASTEDLTSAYRLKVPVTTKTTKRLNQYTASAGTLAVASELSRRGYDAAITLGNTPTLDILCSSPGGTPFTVQVKSVSSHQWVLVRKEHLAGPAREALFFVVV